MYIYMYTYIYIYIYGGGASGIQLDGRIHHLGTAYVLKENRVRARVNPLVIGGGGGGGARATPPPQP